VGGRGVDIVPPLCILKVGIPIAWQENGPPPGKERARGC